MPKGKPGSYAPDELTEAVRRCAADKMSMGATAYKLSTKTRPLTRSAIAGIGRRAGIKFSAKRAPYSGEPRQPKPRRERTFRPAPVKEPVQQFKVRAGQAKLVVQPLPVCSWAGCASAVEDGSMFCYQHGKRGLMR